MTLTKSSVKWGALGRNNLYQGDQECRSRWLRGLRYGSGGSAVFACWDFGFESHRGHGCLTLVNAVFHMENRLCTENNTNFIYILCGQNLEFLNVRGSGTYKYQ
jgi:hypothetical protein